MIPSMKKNSKLYLFLPYIHFKHEYFLKYHENMQPYPVSRHNLNEKTLSKINIDKNF